MSDENRAASFDTVEIAGHVVVAPVLSGYLAEGLCRPLEEYFPNSDPDLWFGWDLERQNRWVVEEMFAGRCAFLGLPNPGEYVACHHIIKRSIATKAARVPWNCIPLMASPDEKRNAHDAVHLEKNHPLPLEILHWDRFDPTNGLAVMDPRDKRRVPNKNLAFYDMPSLDKARAAKEWVRMCLAVYRNYTKSEYELGALYEAGEEYAVILGYKTVKACLNGYGMDTAPFKLGAGVLDNLPVHWDEGIEKFVAMRVMDMIRKMPPEHQETLFRLAVERCSPLNLDDPSDRRNPSFPDWMKEKKELTPETSGPKECTLFDPGVNYTFAEMTTEEIEECDKLVMKGKPIHITG